MSEQWRTAPITEGRYEVSSLGRVRRSDTGRIVGHVHRTGYVKFADSLGSRDRGHRLLSVHRAVCTTFHGPPPFEGAVVRHLDGNQRNNRPENLAWGTVQENADDRVRHGNAPRGERHGRSKLTAEQVRDIHRRVRSGEKILPLAQEYGVADTSIHYLLKGKNWSHIASEFEPWLSGGRRDRAVDIRRIG